MTKQSMEVVAKKNGTLQNLTSASLEKLFLKGDLSVLSPQEKMSYYNEYCNRLGLDPFTQPFKLLKLNGKEVLYCDRSGTQQLSKLHNVSHEIKSREVVNDCYVVVAKAISEGRSTESIGAVGILNATGDTLCNAMMKAETKAKRRATLDLLGLGVLDESEITSIPNAISETIIIQEKENILTEQQLINSGKVELDMATTLPELQEAWEKIPTAIKGNPVISELKDALKKKLTQKQ